MGENLSPDVIKLRALEREGEAAFRETEMRFRQQRAELCAKKGATDPNIGPQERFELVKLSRAMSSARARWQNRARARKKAEYETALARVLAMQVSGADGPGTIGGELDRLETEIRKLKPLAYQPEQRERLAKTKEEYMSLVRELDLLIERELEGLANTTDQVRLAAK